MPCATRSANARSKRASKRSMQRDPSAYRNDILEAAAAIRDAPAAIDEAS
jgi:hypothetical protein